MSLSIMRSVTVKAKVTEQLKRDLAAELQENSRRLDEEMQRLEFQGRRLISEVTKQDVRQAEQIRQGLELQKQKHAEAKNGILEKLREVGNLRLGSEVTQGRVDAPVDVSVGDDWDKLFSVEIVIEDGKVVEIRQ